MVFHFPWHNAHCITILISPCAISDPWNKLNVFYDLHYCFPYYLSPTKFELIILRILGVESFSHRNIHVIFLFVFLFMRRSLFVEFSCVCLLLGRCLAFVVCVVSSICYVRVEFCKKEEQHNVKLL